MTITIDRTEFQSMNCTFLKRASHTGGGPISAAIVDEYVAADGRIVIHEYGMGGESFHVQAHP